MSSTLTDYSKHKRMILYYQILETVILDDVTYIERAEFQEMGVFKEFTWLMKKTAEPNEFAYTEMKEGNAIEEFRQRYMEQKD